MDLFELPAHVVTFDKFWNRWPNKVDRARAEKSWNKAIRAGAKPDRIMEGLEAYITHKPSWQAWTHGATWLNQRRWLAEYGPTRDEAIESELDAVFGSVGK